jgi:hypothetical protein
MYPPHSEFPRLLLLELTAETAETAERRQK